MLIRGDARAIPLRDESVDCVISSPPYWGLRDYGSANQIGLERDPQSYVDSIVSVFTEVWRVLKPEGTVWLNLGDGYASADGIKTSHPQQSRNGRGVCGPRDLHPSASRANLTAYKSFGELKAKDLCGIPWRVAFALQAQGWYLRSDIIWSKPNPMPESVTDRPTKAHEFLFLLTKSERYYYDAHAIAEPVSEAMRYETEQGYDGLGLKDYETAGVQNPSSVEARIIENAKRRSELKRRDSEENRTYWDFVERTAREVREQRKNIVGNMSERGVTRTTEGLNLKSNSEKGNGLTRNKRTVWTIPTMPYSGWTPNFQDADYVAADGKPYKASADCLVHGPLAGRRSQQRAAGDAQLDRDELRRLDTDARRVARQIVAHVSTASRHSAASSVGTAHAQTIQSTGDYRTPSVESHADGLGVGGESSARTSRTGSPSRLPVDTQDCSDLGSEAPATSHSSETHRTGRAPATNPACNPCEKTLDGTAGTSASRDSDSVAHSDESRTVADFVSGGPVTVTARNNLRTAHSDIPSCKCSVLGTDHFATMPEKLVEPCILAGCPLGGLVLDPFVGSGTVVAVAQRLGRRGVGVDLSYQDLAKARTAQRGLLFSEEAS